jgi:hypothetical protein
MPSHKNVVREGGLLPVKSQCQKVKMQMFTVNYLKTPIRNSFDNLHHYSLPY